jgi:hypothetical protein
MPAVKSSQFALRKQRFICDQTLSPVVVVIIDAESEIHMADKKTLSWLLRFIYCDVQKMPPEEFYAVVNELNRFLGSPLAYGEWVEDESQFRQLVAELQRGLRRFLDIKLTPEIVEVEAILSSEGHSAADTEAVGKISKDVEIRKILPATPFQLQLELVLVSDFVVMVGQLDESRRSFRKKPVGGFEGVRIKTKIKTGFDIDGLLLHFLLALNELPGIDLGRCRDQRCEKWFVRTTDHHRGYCSQRCASRHGQFLRRQRVLGDPESRKKYRESAKERAAKSYEKKVRAENPRAKIKKRGV